MDHARPVICWISWPDPSSLGHREQREPEFPCPLPTLRGAAVLGAVALVRRPGPAKAEKPGSTEGTGCGPQLSGLVRKGQSYTGCGHQRWGRLDERAGLPLPLGAWGHILSFVFSLTRLREEVGAVLGGALDRCPAVLLIKPDSPILCPAQAGTGERGRLQGARAPDT